MEDSLFTKIIRGDILSHKIYEDEFVYAFLDIHPIQPGHTLVVPKTQVPYVWDLDETMYRELMGGVHRVARHLREVLETRFVGEQIIGVDVPHAHVHLIPFSTPEQYHSIPDTTAEPDHAALAALAEKLAF